MSLKQTLSRHWFTFQRELFPRLEETLGPLGERYQRLVRVLELVRVEEWLPYPRGWRGRLKEEFGGRHVRVRGLGKVMCHLMFGILALTVER